ncbi:methylenetetrahydrofolate reductase [Adhaeribacter soli]|uniref:Methylenetetrahydrofolate reductase n=1 Tax=Adhaeribacter soli TaxID=2607655 RepID=A0A5N1ISX8_9BACT|nr:methylenetetrahydrofolate reductase [Adhaeribacter soli]KAA9332768.1 methylenetetrahydrofolate reductase [NAD(P)H] [Adhaeribacter soli]
MKITERLKTLTKPAFSFEVLPGAGVSAAESLTPYQNLLDQQPLFVDIPFHPHKTATGFNSQKHTLSKAAPSKEALSRELLITHGLEPLPHLLCKGFSPEETAKTLKDLQQLHVQNLLLLRGDHQQDNGRPDQHQYAFQLVKQVREFNEQVKAADPTQTGFCIGVAGYPEPTRENPDMDLNIQYLKQKVDAGADFILTQLFFDNACFFTFEKRCREAGIMVPIIPGICPLTSFRVLKLLPGFFQVKLPERLQELVDEATDESQLAEIGIEWAIRQAQELYHGDTECVHFFGLSNPEAVEEVVRVVL